MGNNPKEFGETLWDLGRWCNLQRLKSPQVSTSMDQLESNHAPFAFRGLGCFVSRLENGVQRKIWIQTLGGSVMNCWQLFNFSGVWGDECQTWLRSFLGNLRMNSTSARRQWNIAALFVVMLPWTGFVLKPLFFDGFAIYQPSKIMTCQWFCPHTLGRYPYPNPHK